MKRCVAIFGPTASGKSSLGLHLAEKTGGVIISADSMQIYREMDIGTAKPSEEELSLVPHKMVDICSPLESFSVYDFKRMAENEISLALARGELPFVVGGTGLYLDALFHNTNFGEFEIDPDVHTRLLSRVNEGESAQMLKELSEIDPETASPLHEKDVKRILRALEVYLSTGRTLSAFKKESRLNAGEFTYLKIFLNFQDRQELYKRIDERVDSMLRDGLLEETRALLEKGYFIGKTAPQAIGYKELFPYLRGEADLNVCVENLKQKTRNYAKRQLTWFRRYDDAHVIWMDRDPDPVNTALGLIEKFQKGE